MDRRKHLTYANVASTLALVLAISGTAYAAATVTSKDIVNRTIQVKDISKNALFGILPEGAVYVADDGGIYSGANEQTVATLEVPTANMAVFAKMWVSNEGVSTLNMYCRLLGGVTSDIVWTSLSPNGAGGHLEAMSFQITEFFEKAENVRLVCVPGGGTVHVFDVKITALEIGGVRETIG